MKHSIESTKQYTSDKNHFFKQKLGYIPMSRDAVVELIALNELNIQDNKGNSIILYRDDFFKLKRVLIERDIPSNNVDFEDLMYLILEEKLNIKVIRYLSEKEIKSCELDPTLSDFSKDIVTKGGTCLDKNRYNIVILSTDNKIYIYPKIEFNVNRLVAQLGVNHSSLSRGKPVKFAGTLVYSQSRGTWVLLNTSGHYMTRPLHLPSFLKKLEETGVKHLDKLFIQITSASRDLTVEYYKPELFEEFTDRVKQSKKNIDAQLAKKIYTTLENTNILFKRDDEKYKNPAVDSVLNSLGRKIIKPNP